MTQNIVLVIVIAVSIAAHVWIYLWIKFKMDEGAILSFLKDHQASLTESDASVIKAQDIASEVNLDVARVVKVCLRSQDIQMSQESYYTRS